MPLPLLPLLAGVAAVAALALAGKKDGASPGGGAPGQPGSGAPGTFPNPFDKGLTQEQVTAVQTALATESDPTKLEAFAKSLGALGFPLAAAALNAKAATLRAAQAASNVPNLGLPAPVIVPAAAPPTFVPVVTITPSAAPVPAATQAAAQQLAAAIASDPNAVRAAAAQAFGDSLVKLESQEALMGTATIQTPQGGPANLRKSPPSGAVVTTLKSGSAVRIIQPDANPGAQRSVNDTANPLWFMVQQGDNIGWVAGQFVHLNGDAKTNPAVTSPFGGGAAAPTTFSAGLVPAVVGGRVIVTANMLGLRPTPDARAQYCAQAQKGSTFTLAGPEVAGYMPVRDDAGRVAWASKLYLASVAPSRAVAGNDTGAGPSVPFAALHMSALALKTALATHGCRSHNEPLVKDFQRSAKAAGIYQGDIDGWYGTVTQAALSQIVGKPAPACFPEAKGGPVNPNEYWSPMGV